MNTTIISPTKSAPAYLRELIGCWELIFFLAWRDVAVRYKQTALGVGWAIFRPLVTFLFFVIFKKSTGLPSSGNYLVLLISVQGWQLFSSVLSDTSGAFLANSSLISKVYFPRMVLPMSAALVSIIDFVIGFTFFIILILVSNDYNVHGIIVLPLVAVMCVIQALSIGTILATLSVEHRDVRYILPFLLQAGIFVTPSHSV
jgi:lipopolysaccharide transport system permease protein